MNHTALLPAPHLPESIMEKWRFEQRAFRRQLPALLESYRNEYVAIHDGQVIERDADKLDVAGKAYAKVGYVPIYVGLATEEPQSVVRIPSPRTAAKSWNF